MAVLERDERILEMCCFARPNLILSMYYPETYRESYNFMDVPGWPGYSGEISVSYEKVELV